MPKIKRDQSHKIVWTRVSNFKELNNLLLQGTSGESLYIYLAEDIAFSAPISIKKSLQITFSGKGRLYAPLGAERRHFQIKSAIRMVFMPGVVLDGLGRGGGISVSSAGSLVCFGGEFVSCRGVRGGAIESKGGLLLLKTHFHDNRALDLGGAIFGGSHLFLYACNLHKNKAEGDGGSVYSQGSLQIHNSSFKKGEAGGSGGAIYCCGVAQIIGSSFLYNHAEFAGGIYAAAPLTVTSSSIIGNRATYGGGGIYSYFTCSEAKICSRTKIYNNEARFGGGILSYSPLFLMEGTVLRKNRAFESGGGLYMAADAYLKDYSLFEENQAENEGDGIFVKKGRIFRDLTVGFSGNCIGTAETTSRSISLGALATC